MPFPSNVAELRQLVEVMRELGVAEAFHVTLGPPPVAEAPEPGPSLALDHDAADRAQRQKLHEARAAIRDQLGAVGGFDMTDAQVDAFLADA